VSNDRQGALRRLALFTAAVLGGAACANQGLPRGGPEDFTPPRILKITPENNATASKPGAVTIRFDEVVSETPNGERDLVDLVTISPKSGRLRVDWDRTAIQIRPVKGWRPNTVYSVQLKAGLQDLSNNKLDSAIRVVFSMGGPIPAARITGVVFDWFEAKGIGGGIIEAVAQDTTIVFQTVAYSVGRFEFRNLPAGPYLLRGYADRNKNKDLDPLELWDSLRVTLSGYAEAEFHAFGHDTVGLRIATVEPTDSNRALKVTFDKPYSPDQFFALDAVRLTRMPDSALLRVKTAQTTRQKAASDSSIAKRKADSTAAADAKKDTLSAEQRARRDSITKVRAADSLVAAQRQQEREAREAARKTGRRFVQADTTPPPTMKKVRIYKELFITLDSALAAGRSYRLQINGVTSLNGTVKSPARNFTIPKAKVDSSTKKSMSDSTVRQDSASTRARTTRPDTLRR